MLTRLFMLLSAVLSCAVVAAQNITGRVVDIDNAPVDGASVVLQTADSVLVDVVLTAPDGGFSFATQLSAYRIIVQHISYETKVVTDIRKDIGDIVLDAKEGRLRELVVTAERPLVKVEGTALAYDIEAMAQSTTANNAYEALTRLPGVQESAEGVLSLAGAGSLTVVIDGRPSTMSAEQVAVLLRGMPVDRLEKAEVLYSAPPHFHVRGAVINVCLKKNNDYLFQGEAGANYNSGYDDSYAAHANVRVASPQWAFDAMYSAAKQCTAQDISLLSLHNFGGEVYDIRQQQRAVNDVQAHNYRAALEYNVSEKDNLSLAYTGNFSPDACGKSFSDGNFQKSNNVKDITLNRMHNVSFAASLGIGLSFGVDYTDYKIRDKQNMYVEYKGAEEKEIALASGQHVRSVSAYADRTRRLQQGWSIGYGAAYKYTHTKDYQRYSNGAPADAPAVDSRLDETTASLYLSATKQYATGVSFQLSATGEYYTIGNYKKCTLYPQASLTWFRNPNHILQASLSTDKTYPAYWALQSAISYIDGYSEIHGAPELRPMTRYNMNVNYILKQKYVAGFFYIYDDAFFAQTPYQSSERLVLIYKMLNWDYLATAGVNVVVPVKAGGWLDSRFTLVAMNIHQCCDDYFGEAFTRDNLTFSGRVDNTFKLSEGLSLELNGVVQTPVSQGTFDVETMASLTAGAKWTFADKKAVLTLRWNDIFDSYSPKLSLDYNGQRMKMDNDFYTSNVSVNFVYRFGGYKEKEVKKVDTSRFGH